MQELIAPPLLSQLVEARDPMHKKPSVLRQHLGPRVSRGLPFASIGAETWVQGSRVRACMGTGGFGASER